MKNKYRIEVSTENIRVLLLDENGQLEIIYNRLGNGNAGFDFDAEPEEAAREASRRGQLYDREHFEKLGDIDIDCLDVIKNKQEKL